MRKIEKIKHWGFPIGVSALCYFLLLILFSPVKVDFNDDQSNKSNIIMLPIDGKHTDYEKNLIAWMKINNPTLIVKPNREYSYSRVLIDDFKFKLITDDISNNKSSLNVLNDNSIFSKIPINVIPIDKLYGVDDIIANYELSKYYRLPEIPFNYSIKKHNYPCFKNYYTGDIYPYSFPKDVNIEKKIIKFKPIGNTVLDVVYPESLIAFPNVKLIRSSGSHELDKMAIDNIITMTPRVTAEKNAGKTLRIVVEWENLD